MNNVLELKGKKFVQAARNVRGGEPRMNGKELVTVKHLHRLEAQLEQIEEFWKRENRVFHGILISVHYNKIVAKTNRISGLFQGIKSNYAVVGAKFNEEKTKHILTYYLKEEDLEKSRTLLRKASSIMQYEFDGEISAKQFGDKKKIATIRFDEYDIAKTTFLQVIADASYIEYFEVEKLELSTKSNIITLYDTNTDTQMLLRGIGIDVLKSRILDNQTVFLDHNQLQILFEKAPYLVAMATEDLSQLSPDDFRDESHTDVTYLKKPDIEPTIGVIDTLFDERVYFADWVEYHEMVDENLPKDSADYRHGTAVDSIIVDGARLNPWLDDGCGNFRVRHFGVATGRQFSSFTITRKIREIVSSNQDIKVWNISLGSNQEIQDNFISAEAAVLDQIQYENDVIFIIAGTNKPSEEIIKIGAPADSINGIVVNAVSKSGKAPKYARQGLALSFYAKPDVSYYGGSEEEYIHVCEPLGEAYVAGTSFAAPWIARKMSYLIDVLGLNREVAKALLIDSARGWTENPTPEKVALYGHGIVPIRIENIVYTKDDEIKFLVSDVSEKWNTYNYFFPVPMKNDKYPYYAKATMCYFPVCSRSQGVDYTNTELNLHFGRLNDKGHMIDIKGDHQNQGELLGEEQHFILENEARESFRKWDNVKYVVELPKSRKRAKDSYKNKNWGMEIKTLNRLDPQDGVGIRFGVVVTLKAMDGINRIDDFIKSCSLNGWLVNQLDVQARVEINQKINEEIEFE